MVDLFYPCCTECFTRVCSETFTLGFRELSNSQGEKNKLEMKFEIYEKIKKVQTMLGIKREKARNSQNFEKLRDFVRNLWENQGEREFCDLQHDAINCFGQTL